MTIYYELNCGQPVLHRDGRPVLAPLDSVGIAFSKDTDDGHLVLHKHGSPARVRAWLEVAKTDTAGLSLFGEFYYVELPVPMPPALFPVDQLNKAIAGNYLALARLVEPHNTIEG